MTQAPDADFGAYRARSSAGVNGTNRCRPVASRLGTAQSDVILQEHPAAGPGQRCLLRLVEAGPVSLRLSDDRYMPFRPDCPVRYNDSNVPPVPA